MDIIISFFRDTLSGPLYIVVLIICVILICSCIGYLAEVSLNKKKAKQEIDSTTTNVNSSQQVESIINNQSNQNFTIEVNANTTSAVESPITQPNIATAVSNQAQVSNVGAAYNQSTPADVASQIDTVPLASLTRSLNSYM